ncbi:hypothetical protein T09_3873 [Trichinella sp. T9]|nr:hypothetical protein T09_3873 [Trichinella sp. T9]
MEGPALERMKMPVVPPASGGVSHPELSCWLLNKYSLEKGVIITALRSLFIFSSFGQLEIWFR